MNDYRLARQRMTSFYVILSDFSHFLIFSIKIHALRACWKVSLTRGHIISLSDLPYNSSFKRPLKPAKRACLKEPFLNRLRSNIEVNIIISDNV